VNGVDPWGLDTLDNLSNFFAGWGDALTFGGTKHARKWVGEAVGVGDANKAVDYQAAQYRGGQLVGTVHSAVLTRGAGVKLLARRVGAGVARAAPTYAAKAKELATECAYGGFTSFSRLKSFLGGAGRGYAWHHLVEQTPANVARFGPRMIHNMHNVVKVAHGKGSVHARISGLYSSINDSITGSKTLTVRQWLASQSFEEQMAFGLKALDNISKGVW
jgi:hypothetical protein